MNNFTLDLQYVKEVTDKVLDIILDKEIHTLKFTKLYATVTYNGGDVSDRPNGNGYVISYGGILAEIDNLEDDYGKYETQEEYTKAITGILERSLEAMYGITIPAQVIMGI